MCDCRNKKTSIEGEKVSRKGEPTEREDRREKIRKLEGLSQSFLLLEEIKKKQWDQLIKQLSVTWER